MRAHLMVAFTDDNTTTVHVVPAEDVAEVCRILNSRAPYAYGNKIEAIKFLRAKHGYSLRDSKMMAECIEASKLFEGSPTGRKGVDA